MITYKLTLSTFHLRAYDACHMGRVGVRLWGECECGADGWALGHRGAAYLCSRDFFLLCPLIEDTSLLPCDHIPSQSIDFSLDTISATYIIYRHHVRSHSSCGVLGARGGARSSLSCVMSAATAPRRRRTPTQHISISAAHTCYTSQPSRALVRQLRPLLVTSVSSPLSHVGVGVVATHMLRAVWYRQPP